MVECVWNLMAHGDAGEGKWRGNWRMDWVASTLTLPRNMVYSALLTLMRTPQMPAFDWTDGLADLNGLVPFGERRNLFSAITFQKHYNNGCTHAPKCYVVRTLLSCLYSESQQYSGTKGNEHYLGMKTDVPFPLPSSRHAFVFHLLLIDEKNGLYRQYSSKLRCEYKFLLPRV